jgi:hypothetical protein
MSATIVRYRVKPDRVEENATLVRAVYAELAATQPAGFRYTTFVEDDGVGFVHIATVDEGHEAPLLQLAAFQAFRAGLADRCDQPPQSTTMTQRIGGYNL